MTRMSVYSFQIKSSQTLLDIAFLSSNKMGEAEGHMRYHSQEMNRELSIRVDLTRMGFGRITQQLHEGETRDYRHIQSTRIKCVDGRIAKDWKVFLTCWVIG